MRMRRLPLKMSVLLLLMKKLKVVAPDGSPSDDDDEGRCFFWRVRIKKEEERQRLGG